MREMLADSCKEVGEDGTEHCFEYIILVDEMEVSGGLFCESYGVRVVREDGESAEVRNLTVRLERIDELVELLRRNAVSPVTLRDVVEDWL